MLFVLTFFCQEIDSNKFAYTFIRCENNEVVCYMFDGYKKGGMNCKFKEKNNENNE